MVDSPEHVKRLEKKNVRPTAIRLLVVDAILSAKRAVSLSDLEIILDTVDKSSIFRTLELFVKHHVVHAIDDGSGSIKYEICEGEEECTLDDMHIHFYCTLYAEGRLQGLRSEVAFSGIDLTSARPAG